MKVFAFVDTNVLLHYQFFADVDWAAQLGVEAVTLVFAPVVISELDRHKWSGSRREKARAKAVLKKLDSLDLSADAASLRATVEVMALDAEPEDVVFAQHRLARDVNDDRLLASLLSFSHAATDRVLLLTGDGGLRVKARSRRIQIAVPHESLESPTEPDEVERELERTRRDLADVKGATPNLRLTFKGGGLHGQFDVKTVKAFDRATLERKLRAWRSKYPDIRATGSVTIPGVGTISVPNYTPGFVSSESAAEYNREINDVLAQYEAFLREWPDAVNRFTRTLSLCLVLENVGTAPADDVDVHLWTDAPGTWLEERPELPTPPAVPNRRTSYDSLFSMPVPYFNDFSHTAASVVDHLRNVDGPDFSDEGSHQVRYSVKRVKHHVGCELPVVYFQFSADDQAASFAVNVRLVAANIPQPTVHLLNLAVTRAAPMEPPDPDDWQPPMSEGDEE